MKSTLFHYVLLALFVCFVVWLLAGAVRDADACAAQGGELVRGIGWGYTCAKVLR